MASPVNTELKVKGVCYDYLNTAECARMDCKFTHIPPTVPYMDSHCHLDLMMTWKPKLSFSDIPQVPHFKGAISNFCFPKAWRLMDELAHPKVWFTIGVHPKDAPLFDSHQLELASLMKKPKVVAIGECGLDYFHGHTTRLRVLQKEVFDKQATLAHDAGKPLVIHCRDAERDAFEIARKCLSSNHKIHLHCFSSSVDDMWMWMNHFPNLKVGFTNLVTWEKSRVKNAVSAVKSAPLDKILLETDAPHFVPANLDVRGVGMEHMASSTGKFSHPGHALNVAKRIADLKSVKIRDVMTVTIENCKFIYNLQ